MTLPGRLKREETGSVVAELVLLTPLLILVLLFVVALGRLAGARIDVDGAAAKQPGPRPSPATPPPRPPWHNRPRPLRSDPSTSPALSSASALIPPSSSLADR